MRSNGKNDKNCTLDQSSTRNSKHFEQRHFFMKSYLLILCKKMRITTKTIGVDSPWSLTFLSKVEILYTNLCCCHIKTIFHQSLVFWCCQSCWKKIRKVMPIFEKRFLTFFLFRISSEFQPVTVNIHLPPVDILLIESYICMKIFQSIQLDEETV